MNRHEKFANEFMALGDLPLTNEIVNTTEEFTCHLYGYTKQINIRELKFISKIKLNQNLVKSLSRILSQLLSHHVKMY